jgi:plasmid stability protein
MKTISVSVDDETHRKARIRAAETGTTVSAMMRDLLTALLNQPAEPGQSETEAQRRARLLDEALERLQREGAGIDTGRVLTREEMYDRNASR